MAQPHVLVLRSPGTNCDEETAFAFEAAGGKATRRHVRWLLENPHALREYQIFCLPGGFSYGDDISAGIVWANQLRQRLGDALHEFRDSGSLMLGICNGFQALIQTGLLFHAARRSELPATLTWNHQGRYEDRWVRLRAGSTASPFLEGLETLSLPIAHAEGRFVPRDTAALNELKRNGQVALRYALPNSEPAPDQETLPYPHNPNGSVGNVAGLCDPSGRVFGLMPHPERYIHATHHPQWTRRSGLPEVPDGLRIFQNAVRFFTAA